MKFLQNTASGGFRWRFAASGTAGGFAEQMSADEKSARSTCSATRSSDFDAETSAPCGNRRRRRPPKIRDGQKICAERFWPARCPSGRAARGASVRRKQSQSRDETEIQRREERPAAFQKKYEEGHKTKLGRKETPDTCLAGLRAERCSRYIGDHAVVRGNRITDSVPVTEVSSCKYTTERGRTRRSTTPALKGCLLPKTRRIIFQ